SGPRRRRGSRRAPAGGGVASRLQVRGREDVLPEQATRCYRSGSPARKRASRSLAPGPAPPARRLDPCKLRVPPMPPPDTRQAEKDYLARTGSSTWETVKPFSPPGLDTLGDSAFLLHDFASAMLALHPSPDALILDLGAGGGWCSDLLGRLNRASVAVDISFDMLRAARQRPGSTIRAAVGDMEALPFRSGTFQQALCFTALHHVPRMAVAVREIARVLDDTGIAFFSEPGKGHAEAAVSTAAMRDFGVLEQDVVIEQFMHDCHEAGFVDVRLKPLANAIPHFDLTREQWADWSRLATSTRPRRAWQKIALGAAEIFGLGNRGPVFEDTFADR